MHGTPILEVAFQITLFKFDSFRCRELDNLIENSTNCDRISKLSFLGKFIEQTR